MIEARLHMPKRVAEALAALACLAAGLAVLPAAAPASTIGTPLALDALDNGTPPQIAYDPTTGTTYVAWSAPGNQNSGNGIDLCVLPSGSSACESGSPVLLTDPVYPASSDYLNLAAVMVLPNGDAVVLGVGNTNPTVAWESAPGGGGFLTGDDGLQDSGQPISNVSLYYEPPDGGVPLSDSDVGLYDNDGEYFADAPFTGTAPNVSSSNADPGGQFPGHFVDSDGLALAAMSDPSNSADDIVVGVGQNESSLQQTPTGCTNYAATGYGATVGKVDGTSNATGTLNHEGLPAYQLLACSAATPVLAQDPQGTGGIGVFEQEGDGWEGASPAQYTLDYRPFVPSSSGGTFGSPVELENITGISLVGADSLDLSDDAGGGVYASWEDLQGLVMDYSPNGGSTWDGPVVIPGVGPYAAAQGDPEIVGVGGGTALLAYESNLGEGDQVFLQAISLLPSPVTPPAAPTPTTTTTTQAAGGTSGADISIPAGTVDETDTARLSGTNAATATGTMTYRLSSSSSCATSGDVFDQTTAVTDGVAAPATVSSTALPPGTYYWTASYSGDSANLASTSACGSEVLKVTPAATAPSSTTSNGTTITITISCAGPCTVSVTITVDPPAASAAGKSRKPKIVTIATGKLTLTKAGSRKLKLKLTGKEQSALKSLFKKDHGKVKATITLSTKTAHGTFKSTGTLLIKRT